MKLFLFLTPRLLALLIAIFLEVFAFDIFDVIIPFEKKFGIFMIHSIPSLFLLVATHISWKNSLLGIISFSVLLLGFSLYYNTLYDTALFLVISVPLMIIAFLYALDYFLKKYLKHKIQ